MGRRDRSYDYDSSSSGSESDDRRSYRSRSSHRRKAGNSSSSKGRSSRRRDKSRDRARTPEPPPRIPEPAKAKPPKIAMILLLGQDEVEFKLTEAHLLFDSPNDLTSTYYADNSGEVRTYRMPDRDAAIFQIIFRYMNREIVLPLRKASIPKYLSYEQTEAKLAEEAKFYRLTRLMRMLPPPPSTSANAGGGGGAPAGSGASAASSQGYASSIADSDRSRTLSDIHPPPMSQPQTAATPIGQAMNMPQTLTPYHANMPLPPQMPGMPGMPLLQASVQTLVPPTTAMPQYQQQPMQQQPYPQQQYAAPGPQVPIPMATPSQSMMSATPSYTASQPSLPPTAMPTSHAPSPMHLQPPPGARPPRTSRSETSYSDRLRSRSGTRSRRESLGSSHSMLENTSSSPGSRRQSISSIAAKLPSNAVIRPPATVFAYLYKSGGHSITKNEPPFPIVGFPDHEPLPHLFIKATAAEIKFSAFRNAEDNELFEMRYSIRILDEPATRPLAYRVKDTTIKSVDSHLRLNGVITDIECRDIPIRIKHSVPATNAAAQGEQRIKGALSAAGNIIADDDGSFTSGFDELLELMTTKGYVKWPRIWQDTFTNITAVESLHQRVCLTSCEVLLDIEFPEEAAAISEAVGGRGFTLNEEDQDDLLVRNYRVTLHGVKVETRKMRRLRELEELDLEATPRPKELQDAKALETPKPLITSSRGGGVPPYSANARANLVPSNASVSASTMLDRARVSRDIINFPETPLPTSGSRGRSARPPDTPISEGLLTPRPPHRSTSSSRGHSRPPATPSSYVSSAGSYDDHGEEGYDDDEQSLAPSSIPPTPKASRGRPPVAAVPRDGRGGAHLAPPEQLRSGRGGNVSSSSRGGKGGYAPSTYTTGSRASGMSGMSGASGTEYSASLAPSSPAPSGYSEGSRRSEWSDVYSESGQSEMSRGSQNPSRYSRSSAPSLKVPPSEYSVDRPRSTASEDIKRRTMARWK